jgi:hypothetical protein
LDWRSRKAKHTHLSAAGSLVLSMFFGNSADFSASVTIEAGSSKIEPGITPATNVVISWPRLIDTADDAGWSRRWGGIHFQTSDEHGRGLGKRIGSNVWTKAQAHFNGTASQPT